MAYCTHSDVSAFLQRDAFDANSKPTSTAVTAVIADWQSWIDKEIGHSFESTTVTDEYHSIDAYRYGGYHARREIGVSLSHREINSITSLEVFDGGSWQEWIGSKTEGRSDDYWINYTDGILFFRSSRPHYRQSAFRVSYTYGASSVPNAIRGACIRKTAISVITGTHTQFAMGHGPGNVVSYAQRIELWEREIKQLLAPFYELTMVTA